MSEPFILSIETSPGESYQHGFHLGTDERLARQIAEERFHGRVNNHLPVVTVALIRNGKMVDCYCGYWFKEKYEKQLAMEGRSVHGGWPDIE